MHIEQLGIRNFRGIKKLLWAPNRGLNCLVGPGDSGKTTVLDAIEMLFAERTNVNFDDLDFYDSTPANSIRITAVVGRLPTEYLREGRYGLLLSGYNEETCQWAPEPHEANGYAPVLTLQLDVDESFEPTWSIYIPTDTADKTQRLKFADRKEMAPARLGAYATRHLSWGKGSALSRVGAHPERLPASLNALLRGARDAFAEDSADTFAEVVKSITPALKNLGVDVRGELAANLDHTSFSANASGVALHDGNIPLRCMGTGSSRLAVAALQSTDSAGRHMFLVDELEFGLEPHRISLLMSYLRKRVEASGQVFTTTHSTATLREARFEEVFVCRRDADSGEMIVSPASTAATPALAAKQYIRDKGEALLARTVLVCEGQTEVALLKGFAEGADLLFQARNAALIDGGGANTPAVALHFAQLGYRTAILSDSDVPLAPKVAQTLAEANIPHFEWGDTRCTEQELMLGLDFPQRRDVLFRMAREVGEPRMLGEVSGAFRQRFDSIDQLTACLVDNDFARQLGGIAHSGKWIKKDYDLCFEIGAQVVNWQYVLGGGSMVDKLQKIFDWLAPHD
ncbi:ATP-dependent nuclease [Burkholderia gladioli]|uniref:ATP-dependent nuclease n=1 Tax=Burkholderia gladioli TaxID=28095 RepID=UPI00163E2295|nr:AAA family ATPase [Burkholderia gladioli]